MPETSSTWLTRAYYQVKPFLPRGLRWAIRRRRAVGIRRRHASVWPIDESVAATPTGWPGWPDGKRAAFVLTHDVEGLSAASRIVCESQCHLDHGRVGVLIVLWGDQDDASRAVGAAEFESAEIHGVTSANDDSSADAFAEVCLDLIFHLNFVTVSQNDDGRPIA